jgi:hypothetical protein
MESIQTQSNNQLYHIPDDYNEEDEQSLRVIQKQ